MIFNYDNSVEIDVPFNSRHLCWFCEEYSTDSIDVREDDLRDSHPDYTHLIIPVCPECKISSKTAKVFSLDDMRVHIKENLISQYSKYLSIGSNWTEKELKESDFNGSVLGGFKKSAWDVYLQAKERVNFKGWEIIINGIPLFNSWSIEEVTLNGVRYSTAKSAIDYVTKYFKVKKSFLEKVISIVGLMEFEYAVKYCRNVAHKEMWEEEIALENLKEELEIKNDSVKEVSLPSGFINITEIEPIFLKDLIVYRDVILWAMMNGITTLDEFDERESLFWDNYSTIEEDLTKQYYDGIEAYLEKRTYSKSWVEKNDHNNALWQKASKQLELGNVISIEGSTNILQVDASNYDGDISSVSNTYIEIGKSHGKSISDDEKKFQYKSFAHQVKLEGDRTKRREQILNLLSEYISNRMIKRNLIIAAPALIEVLDTLNIKNFIDYQEMLLEIDGESVTICLPFEPKTHYLSWKLW